MSTTICVCGKPASGKSRLAERIAQTMGGSDVGYVGTLPRWQSTRARIVSHKRARPVSWLTVEAYGLEYPDLIASVVCAERRVWVVDGPHLLVLRKTLSDPRLEPVATASTIELLTELGRQCEVQIVVCPVVGADHPLASWHAWLHDFSNLVAEIADEVVML